MIFIIFKFCLSALVIVGAGSFLTRFADNIAEKTGWGKMFVGGLLLAGATSLPELMVDIKAVRLNLPDLAVGDLLGSSLFNLLILATLDFTFPSEFRRTAFSPAFLHHALAAVLTIVLTCLVGIGIASRLETSFWGVSIFSWAVLVVYLYGLRLIYLEGRQEKMHPFKNKSKSLAFSLFGYIGCAALIVVAAPFLVSAADELALRSGLGHTFIGTTLVALATSLPELVATLAAFKIGAPDLALGNVFGSNAFNMILFVPLDYLFKGDLFSSVKIVHAVTAMCVVAAMGIAVMGQLYRKKQRSAFTEPSSEIVVTVIVAFLILLYAIK